MQYRFSVIFAFICLAGSSISTRSEALTEPIGGAENKPKRLRLRAPFPCGTELRINCGYGPNCSPAHKHVNSPGAPNDYYAVDFTRNEPKGGFDKPITAAAKGVVLEAGWAKGGYGPLGKIVYIEHAYKDKNGKPYQTIYAHLHRVLVRKGQRISAGTPIGTMGGSSSGKLSKFGPHLHFALYHDARRTIGGGVAVVPEPMGNFEDIHTRMRFKACGDPEKTPTRVAELDLPVDYQYDLSGRPYSDGKPAFGGLLVAPAAAPTTLYSFDPTQINFDDELEAEYPYPFSLMVKQEP